MIIQIKDKTKRVRWEWEGTMHGSLYSHASEMVVGIWCGWIMYSACGLAPNTLGMTAGYTSLKGMNE